MKKLCLILTTFIILLNNTSAQITLEEGKPVKCGSNVPQKILGKNEKYFFVFRRANLSPRDKNYYIEKYAIADMSLVSKFDITLQIKTNDKVELKDAFYLNGKFLVFRTSTDSKKENVTLFLQTISEDGAVNKELSEVYKIKTTPLANAFSYAGYSETDFRFSISNDNKILLITAEEIMIWDGVKSIEKISTKLFDSETMSFKEVKEIPNQYKETKIYPWNYKVDGSGNVYFIYNYFNSDKNLQTAIGLLAPNSSSIIGMDINVDRTKYKIEDIDYLINDNTIYCSGIYKNKIDKKVKVKNNQMELFGVFSQKINTSTYKTEQSDSKPFTNEIIQKLTLKYAYNNFKVDHIKIINNEVYTIGHLYWPNSALLVYKTNTQGKIEWTININNNFSPKIHSNAGAYLYLTSCYYHIYATKDNLSIIINENPQNLKKIKDKSLYDLGLSKYKSYAKLKGTNVVYAKIDKSGIVERDVISKNEKFCLLFLPKVMRTSSIPFPLNNNLILPLTDNEILIYMKDDKGKGLYANNKNDKFGKITFK